MIIDNIYRRPNVLEILQKCKTFTRWRMTDEVKEILSDIKEPKKAPVKEKKVDLTNEYSYIESSCKENNNNERERESFYSSSYISYCFYIHFIIQIKLY